MCSHPIPVSPPIVRVRPPTSWEAARLPQQVYDACIRGDGALSTGTPGRITNHTALRDIVEVVDDRVLTFDPQEKDASKAFVERGFVPPGTKRYKDRRFIFDRVFRHDASQTEVYGSTARPLLKTLLDGFNTTIFAYGVRVFLCAPTGLREWLGRSWYVSCLVGNGMREDAHN